MGLATSLSFVNCL